MAGLASWMTFGRAGSASQAATARSSSSSRAGGVEPGGRAVAGGDRHAGDRACAAAERAGDGHADRGLAGVLVEPAGDLAGAQDRAGQVEAGLGLGLDGLQVRIQPLAQHPELERVEDLVHRLAVPALPAHVLGAQRQLQVADQGVELVVAHDVGQVGAQALPGLALDLVDVGDDAVEAAVLNDPLGGGLVADAGHAGQVVAGLADQGGLVAVEARGNAVFRLDGLGGHPPDLGDAADRVQNGDVLAGELERVAVAGGDDHLHARLAGLGGERGDDVVGLVAGLFHHRDAQRLAAPP